MRGVAKGSIQGPIATLESFHLTHCEWPASDRNPVAESGPTVHGEGPDDSIVAKDPNWPSQDSK